MRNKPTYIWASAVLIALPVLGYFITYGLTPQSHESSFAHAVLYIIIIAILLIIPYAMLKIFGHASHIWNRREKEVQLKDIPKDKDELQRKS